jgi:diguanylate cyclase (GGDEF)-like protein
VVVIDLDHFKFVNSSLGHATGDRLLKAMAGRLRGMLRDGDTVRAPGRRRVRADPERPVERGGDLPRDAAHRRRARAPLEIDGKELVVTCSAGISLYPQDGPDVETLLKNADAAMYRAKEHGRNNFRFFTAEMNERVNERLALESALRRALERRELVLHYQSRVDLASRRDQRRGGAAALAAPGMGPGAPGALRPARRGDRPHRADRRVRPAGGLPPDARLDRRRPRARAHVGQPVGAPVPRGRLVRKVSRVLEETGLHPQSLELELTESTVMHDVDAAIATLQGLKSLGVSLSVDDFGTGYSSLSYLENLPSTS